MANPFTPVFDGTFATTADLSMLMLYATFGNVITFLLQGMGAITGSDTLLKAAAGLGMIANDTTPLPYSIGGSDGLIAAYNSGGLFLGSLFLFFVTIMGIWNTASDGEALGRKWNKKTTTLRTLSAFTMLIPGAYGYNVIQMFVLTVAILSCGLASKTWEAFVSSAVTRQVEMMIASAVNASPAFTPLVETAYQMRMCNAGYTNANSKLGLPLNIASMEPTAAPAIKTVNKSDAGVGYSTMAYGLTTFDTSNKTGSLGMCGAVNVSYSWNLAKRIDNTSVGKQQEGIFGTYTTAAGSKDPIEEAARAIKKDTGCLMMQAAQVLAGEPEGGCVIENGDVQAEAATTFAAIKAEMTDLVTTSTQLAADPSTAINLDTAVTAASGDILVPGVTRLHGMGIQLNNLMMKSFGHIIKKQLTDASSGNGTNSALYLAITENITKYGWMGAGAAHARLGRVRDTIRDATTITQNYAVIKPKWDFPLMEPKSGDNYVELKRAIEPYHNIAIQAAVLHEAKSKTPESIEKEYRQGVTNMAVKVGAPEAVSMMCGVTNPFSGESNDKLATTIGQDSSDYLDSVFMHFGASMSMSIARQLGANGADPLLQIKSAGDCIITAAEILMVARPLLVGVAEWITTRASSVLGKGLEFAADVTTLGTAGNAHATAKGIIAGFVDLLSMLAPLMYAILAAGFVMAYFLPMMPFIVMSLSIVGWLVAVVEAIVSVVLWAVMHFSPGGDSFMGSQEKGYLLIMSVFMRPVLIIIGLCIGLVLLYPVSWFIGQFFSIAVSSVQGQSFVTGLAGFVAMTYIYIIVMYNAIKLCLGLPQTLPSEVMNWVGGFVKDFGETNAAQTAGGIISGAGSSAASGVPASVSATRQKRADEKAKDIADKRTINKEAMQSIQHHEMMDALRGNHGGSGGSDKGSSQVNSTGPVTPPSSSTNTSKETRK